MTYRFRNKPRATAVRAVALAAVGLLAFGTHAAAEDTPPVTEPEADTTAAAPVVAASSAVTLPLFGAPLVVDINMDPAGNLVDVALNQPGDFTASTVKPNKVVFVNEVEGVSVKVKAKHGGERIDARAADLAGVSGPGQWSGDVFENGQATVVDFTVGAGADGAPDITAVWSRHRSSSRSARPSTTLATSTLGRRSRSSSPTPARAGRCGSRCRRAPRRTARTRPPS